MKRLILRLLLWPLLPAAVIATARAGEMENRFARARQVYDEGRYEEALAIYDALALDYPRMPEVHFNRGNTLARLGRVGPAIAAFERARLLAPRDPDIRANLKFLRERAALPAPESSWLEKALNLASPLEWRYIAVAGWWLGALGLSLGWLLTSPPRWLRSIGLALLLCAAVAAFVSFKLRRLSTAVAIENTTVRFAPLPDATPHFEAPAGFRLRVLERQGDWLRVREGNREGWLPASSVEFVDLV